MKLFITIVFTVFVCNGYCKGIKPFKSDGCSMFPNKITVLGGDWCSCCEEHDVAYWQGGTREQRDSADNCLLECVYAATLNDKLAHLMRRGVASGGSAFFPVWYRWGYGWRYGRGYRPVSPAEKVMIQQQLDFYYLNSTKRPCQ